jgi:valyl-tRNA synthetase
MNECVRQQDFNPKTVKQTVNRWIAGETERVAKEVTLGLETYKFNEASGAIYEFTWGVFCDWYVELIKPLLAGDDEEAKAETRATVAWVLDQIYKLLHPFMPFITEELWAHMVEHGVARRNLLCLSEWPTLDGLLDEKADAEIAWVIRLVSDVRSVRQEMNVPAGAKVPLVVSGENTTTRQWLKDHEDTLKRLARAESITVAKAAPKQSALMVVGEATVALPLAGIIDMDVEKKRLEKEIAKSESDLGKAETWLANPSNVTNSPEHVVSLNRERVTENTDRIQRLKAALKRIEG